MRLRAVLILCAAATFDVAWAGAPDTREAEALYEESCKNCHGPRAQGMASFPKLAGLAEDHLVMRLEQYRAGEKVGPNSALMEPNAADLSDEEIMGLAAYIATTFE